MKYLFALFFICFNAHAGYLYSETATPDESMDEFVLRIYPRALAYTLDHDVEVCGAIGKDNGVYTLRIKTDNNPWECKVSQVEGTFTGYLFHTHAERGNDSWAPADLKIPGYLATPRKLLWQDQNRMKKLKDIRHID